MKEHHENITYSEHNPYGFKAGDEVITADGRKGVIAHICTCGRCEKRGFYEPCVKFNDGEELFITGYDKDDNFGSFYKIGDLVLGNINDKYLYQEMQNAILTLDRVSEQLAVLRKLKGGE